MNAQEAIQLSHEFTIRSEIDKFDNKLRELDKKVAEQAKYGGRSANLHAYPFADKTWWWGIRKNSDCDEMVRRIQDRGFGVTLGIISDEGSDWAAFKITW